jgi:hypothetical protein
MHDNFRHLGKKHVFGVPLRGGKSGSGLSWSDLTKAYSLAKTGAELGSKALSAYSSQTAKDLINYLPSSDSNARPGFAGEQHMVLKLANNRPGVANYAGPGTQLEKRLVRGDPPRSGVDAAAQAHDIRYALARNTEDQHVADRKFIDALSNPKLDSAVNRLPAREMIRAKMTGEKLGVFKPNQFAQIGLENPNHRPMMEAQLGKLQQKGLGASFQQLGTGLKLAGQGDGGALKLAGQGLKEELIAKYGVCCKKRKKGGALASLASVIAPFLLNQLNKKVGIHGFSPALLNSIKSDIMGLSGKAMDVARNSAKSIIKHLPSLRGSGKYIGNYIKHGLDTIKEQKGNGIIGKGFWDDFGRGFVQGFTGTLKAAAPLIPLLL